MALFVAENPVLGVLTTLQEASGYAGAPAASPTVTAYKPTTREVVSVNVDVVTFAATGTKWIFEAPWNCKILNARFNCSVISSDATPPTLDCLKVTADATAITSGTSILAATVNLHTIVANTRQELTLTATKSVLLMNAGDQLGISVAGHAPTGLVGGNLQIEIAQIG
jgi:hypothetical protein